MFEWNIGWLSKKVYLMLKNPRLLKSVRCLVNPSLIVNYLGTLEVNNRCYFNHNDMLDTKIHPSIKKILLLFETKLDCISVRGLITEIFYISIIFLLQQNRKRNFNGLPKDDWLKKKSKKRRFLQKKRRISMGFILNISSDNVVLCLLANFSFC